MGKADAVFPAQPEEVDRIAYAAWLAEAKRRFGDDPHRWRFACVRCGHVQTIQDFMDAGLSYEDAQARVYFSCIGRVTEGVGCDWSLGGLFRLHTPEVEMPDGEMVPAFRFAEEVEAHA